MGEKLDQVRSKVQKQYFSRKSKKGKDLCDKQRYYFLNLKCCWKGKCGPVDSHKMTPNKRLHKYCKDHHSG